MTELTLFQQKVSALLPNIELRFSESMAKHTSFRIGGPAEVMAFPKQTEELAQILKTSALLDITPAILGAGTNILAPDAGISGLVICLKDCMNGMQQLDETHIRVMSGVTMSRAAVFAANLGLSGMEFAHGIPGTVGGGIYMNAGAYGGEMRDVCESVQIMDFSGDLHEFSAEEMDFSYRHSVLETKPGIVVSAVFRLNPAPEGEIRERMKMLQSKRSASQPLDKPSAGSAFKRPANGYAAALIDQAGLRGFSVGGAAVSEKHTGFVVNLGGASAEDVLQLMQQVSDRVFASSGIRLEPEIRLWNANRKD